jgi:metal-responsive CopG/Arc/MetJ family transcriptional regulator
LVDRIDEYRFAHGIRSRSEAIRRLVEKGLHTGSASQERQDRMDAWDADVARLDVEKGRST